VRKGEPDILTKQQTERAAQDDQTQVLPVADDALESEGPATEKPKLADGIDLIGKYEGSGFKVAPYLARRADGQVIQLAPLLYLIAELADGERTNEEIGDAVSEAIERGVSADNVRMLVDEKLRPLGVIAGGDGAKPELQKLDPMLALKFRAALVPPNVVNAVTTVFKPLFFPLVVVAVLGGLVALDVWLFFFHGIAQSIAQTLNNPALLLLMLGLVVLSAAFHECGHASACSYGGAKPGAMGAGIYIVWPAFYTDVTDAYRLDKRGRLRTDLGGVYFNVIFILATAGAYALTGFEPLLLMIPLQHLEIIHQFLPFIRLDGYYIVSDLTGVPDMFARIRPTLASFVPWKKTSDRVKELKPWVRIVVTTYVLTVIPVLLFMFAMMAYNAPRIFATGYDSFITQYHKVGTDFGSGSAFAGYFGIVQMLILLLPALGIIVTFWRTGFRVGRGIWTKTEGNPPARFACVMGGGLAAAVLAYNWFPSHGDYRAIQPGDRGVFAGAFQELESPPIRVHRPRSVPRTPSHRHDPHHAVHHRQRAHRHRHVLDGTSGYNRGSDGYDHGCDGYDGHHRPVTVLLLRGDCF
jgi:putative peptide zinc metalloprotease protein